MTSANLSNVAFNSSLEVGVLICGATAARLIQRQIDALIASGVLRAA